MGWKKVFLITVSLFLFMAGSAQAAEENASFVFGGDRFDAGTQLLLDQQAVGDRYVAGADVTVNGQTGGDILAAGSSVVVIGPVAGDIRAAGGKVIISGTVDKNVTVAGGEVTVDKDAVIKGNLLVAGGKVALDGQVKGVTSVGGGDVRISGQLGSTRVDAEKVTVLSGAKINGDFRYVTSTANIEENAQITGQKKQIMPKRDNKKDESSPYIKWVISLFGSVLLTAAIGYFFPRFAHKSGAMLNRSFWQQLGVGFLFIIGFILVVILLLISIIGTPLGIFALITYIFLLIMAGFIWIPVIALWSAELLQAKLPTIQPLVLAMVSAVILSAFTAVPIMGSFFTVVGYVTVTGIIVNLIVVATRHGREII